MLRNALSMKLRKEKASQYSNQLTEKQDSRKLWKTLNELKPNKKQHKTANAPAAENLTATSFNEFFTSVRQFRKKPEVAWKHGCRKKFQDGASKY